MFVLFLAIKPWANGIAARLTHQPLPPSPNKPPQSLALAANRLLVNTGANASTSRHSAQSSSSQNTVPTNTTPRPLAPQ